MHSSEKKTWKKVLFLGGICMMVGFTACQTVKGSKGAIEPNAAPSPTEKVSETPAAPSPIEKAEPMKINNIETGGLQIKEFVINERNMEIVFAYGNVLLIYCDGKYGAMDYDGQVLVENVYENLWVRPNGDGDFALGNDQTVSVFNANGEQLLEIASPREMFINERILTYVVDKEEGFGTGYAYNLKEGKYIATFEALYVSATSEEKFYFSDQFGLEVMGIDGNCQMLWDYWKVYNGRERVVPTLYEGIRGEYGAVSCGCTSGHYIGLIRSDGQELILVDEDELIEYAGWDSCDACGIYTYQAEGVRYGNYEKQIVIFLDKGEESKFFLIDFAKAEMKKPNVFTTFVQEHTVANLADIILGEYDWVCMSASGVHATTKDGKSFYVDKEGNVLGEYKQVIGFKRDHGLILDEENTAYLVNKEGQKVYGGLRADSIISAGNAYGIIGEEQKIYWLVE